jgi:hypothetical protein
MPLYGYQIKKGHSNSNYPINQSKNLNLNLNHLHLITYSSLILNHLHLINQRRPSLRLQRPSSSWEEGAAAPWRPGWRLAARLRRACIGCNISASISDTGCCHCVCSFSAAAAFELGPLIDLSAQRSVRPSPPSPHRPQSPPHPPSASAQAPPRRLAARLRRGGRGAPYAVRQGAPRQSSAQCAGGSATGPATRGRRGTPRHRHSLRRPGPRVRLTPE